jgi:hypothetical protein
MAVEKEKGDTERGHQIEGRYANCFQVGYNAFEFAIDFGQFYANGSDGRIHTRIITSPNYMKALLQTLTTSIGGYEREFGEIGSAHNGVSSVAQSVEKK